VEMVSAHIKQKRNRGNTLRSNKQFQKKLVFGSDVLVISDLTGRK